MKIDLIPPDRRNRPSTRKVEYITVHETDNTNKGANAAAHASYLATTNDKISWHYSVDNKGVIQHIPDGEIAWHSGTTRGNETSIGIEICVNSDGDFEASVRNAAELVKELLKTHNLTIDKVVQHNYWNGKNCPKTIRQTGRWEEFLKMIDPSRAKVSRYEYKDGIHFVYIPIERFKILLWDKPKKTTAIKNYFNLGFFGIEKSGKTVAGGNVAIDGKIIVDSATAPTWSNLYNKTLSTLLITDKAEIKRVKSLSGIKGLKYAISGIPVIEKGQDVSYSRDVLPQGYTGGELYATWHGFLGVRKGELIYMAFKTKTSNLVATCEAWNKLKKYGFDDVIKLDGGGSFVLDNEGKNVAVTSGNRRINTVGLY